MAILGIHWKILRLRRSISPRLQLNIRVASPQLLSVNFNFLAAQNFLRACAGIDGVSRLDDTGRFVAFM